MRVLLLLLPLVTVGCADVDSVLFVTKTSVGVDFDSKPGNIAIAQDRIEGFLGPRYANGELPPVVSSLSSDLAVFSPAVKQTYATGRAARNLVSNNTFQNREPDLSGEKRLAFFGTTTTTGLKVGFTGQVPDSLTFGYKRKEYSFIPLGTIAKPDGTTADVYPSVLATIDMSTTAAEVSSTGVEARQFFATGLAAEEYATDTEIRRLVRAKARKSFEDYENAVNLQSRTALVAIRCFNYLDEDEYAAALDNGIVIGLFKEPEVFREHSQKMKAAPDDATKRRTAAEIRGDYASDVGIVDGSTPTMNNIIEQHRKFVCDLAAT